ncbi:UNVERIFIED_CONTAM: hypothetical protein GTU68_041503 [Idotea baltica]|nr:hypothetical protein [Idotea baltica]
MRKPRYQIRRIAVDRGQRASAHLDCSDCRNDLIINYQKALHRMNWSASILRVALLETDRLNVMKSWS